MSTGVYKRGDVWYIRYDVSPEAGGKRRQRWESCKGLTKKQAEALRAERLKAVRLNTYADPEEMTVEQLARKWLQRPGLRPNTIEGYERHLDNHILPELGNLYIHAVQPLDIDSFYARMLKKGNKRGGGLSAQTVKHLHTILHSMFSQAMKWRLISINPLDAVTTPRVPRREAEAVDEEGIMRLLEIIGQTKYGIAIAIAIGTGMRRSEALGLKWTDYDATKGDLVVRRSLCETKAGIEERPPKNGKPRVIGLPDYLVEVLNEHRQKRDGVGYICTNEDGTRMKPSSLSDTFRYWAKKLGIRATFHGLRHTQATVLIAAGVSIKAVSERLGHSTAAILLNIYTHVLPHSQQEAVTVINEAFGKHMSAK